MQTLLTADDCSTPRGSHAQVGRAPVSDEVLFEALACSSHRPAAIGEVWRLHARRVWALAAPSVGPDDADDVVSVTFDVLTRLAEEGRTAYTGRPIAVLVNVIGRNTARSFANRRARRFAHELSWPEDAEPEDADGEPIELVDPAAWPADDEQPDLADLLVDALATLSARSREIVRLRAVEGLPSSEVGARLQMKPGAIDVAYYRARNSLRQALQESLDQSRQTSLGRVVGATQGASSPPVPDQPYAA